MYIYIAAINGKCCIPENLSTKLNKDLYKKNMQGSTGNFCERLKSSQLPVASVLAAVTIVVTPGGIIKNNIYNIYILFF